MTPPSWTIFIALAMLFGACQRDVAPPESPTTTTPHNPVATATATATAGATTASAPTPIRLAGSRAADCPLTEPEVPRKAGIGYELAPFCIFWNPGIASPDGFRVVIKYLNSGEMFVYDIPATATALIPRDEHAPRLDLDCGKRHVFQIELRSLPDLTPLDATSATVECGSPVSGAIPESR